MEFLRRHDVSHMNMGSGDDMMSNSSGDPMMMNMVFHTRTMTPLYSSAWTPMNSGTYAGTCIFLVVLSIVARLLIALRTTQEARWLDKDMKRRYVAVREKVPLSEAIAHDPDAKKMVLSANGVEETVFVVARKSSVARPWRFSVDPVRAVMDTAIVGVGYLL